MATPSVDENDEQQKLCYSFWWECYKGCRHFGELHGITQEKLTYAIPVAQTYISTCPLKRSTTYVNLTIWIEAPT